MTTTVNDIEKAVNSGLATTIKRSEINFCCSVKYPKKRLF